MRTTGKSSASTMTEAEFIEIHRKNIDSGMFTEAYVRARYRYETRQGSYQEAHDEYLKTRAYLAQVETNKKYPV